VIDPINESMDRSSDLSIDLLRNGAQLASLGYIPSAIAYFLLCLRCDPENSIALSNLGEAFRIQGELKRAEQCLIEAVKIEPSNANALYNLGVLYQQLDHLNIAIDLYEKVLVVSPDNARAIYNLAICHKSCGHLDVSHRYYEYLFVAGDKRPEFLWNYSLVKLKIGDYAQGLHLYENRFYENSSVRPIIQPPIDKITALKGEVLDGILVVAEQGLGDTIQFVRYCSALNELQVPFEVCVPESLFELLSGSITDISFIHPHQVNHQWLQSHSKWKWIPMMSLPHALSIDPSRSGSQSKYLVAEHRLVTEWQTTINIPNHIRIGLSWQGNPGTESSNLRGRSIPLSEFKPLLLLENIKLVCLQHGFGVEQLERCEFLNYFVTHNHRIDFMGHFKQVLAIMNHCDVIITSDTAVAHLAGAAGLRVYLLLHSNCDWRWGSESNTTFWYENTTIFRQKISGKWNDVFDEVVHAVACEFNLSMR